MKTLISGATGFIGGHLTKRLAAEGHTIRAVNRAENEPDAIRSIIRSEGPFDGVIHLASLFLKDHQPEDISALIESNVLFGTHLLDAASEAGIPWFLNTGSYWEHDKEGGYDPANLYAATKQAFENIGTYYARVRGINFLTLKLFDTFGPGDTRPKIFNLWEKIAETGETLDMSPGGQIMDMNYVDNVIGAYLRAVELLSSEAGRNLSGQIFAVSSGERMTLKELAHLFGQATGKTLNIKWGAKPYRPKEIMEPWIGKTLPGWKLGVSLEEGIRRTFGDAGKKA